MSVLLVVFPQEEQPKAIAAWAAAFVAWTRRTARPLIDLSLFRDRRFTGGAVPATLLTFALFGVLFVTPQYFQAVLGSDALGSGLRLLPLIGGLFVTSRLSPRLIPRYGAALPIARSHVDVAGLPPGAAGEAGDKVGGGLAVASRLHDPGLLRSARSAFVHAWTSRPPRERASWCSPHCSH
jgi:hypothetical protein